MAKGDNVNRDKLIVYFFASREGEERGPYGCCCASYIVESTGAEALPDDFEENDYCIGCNYPIVRG
jgi:hypothetical protein